MRAGFTPSADPLPRGGKLLLGDSSAATPKSGTPDFGAELTPAAQFPVCRLRRRALRPAISANPARFTDRARRAGGIG